MKDSKNKSIKKSASELPSKPDFSVLKHQVNTDKDQTKNIDAIAGLAFIENVKSGTTEDQWSGKGWEQEQRKSMASKVEDHGPPDLPPPVIEHHYEKTSPMMKLANWAYAVIILVSAIGTVHLIQNKPVKIASNSATIKNKTKATKTKNFRTPASFKKTQAKSNVRSKSKKRKAAKSFRQKNIFKKHKVRKLQDNALNNRADENDDSYDDDQDYREIANETEANEEKENLDEDNDYNDQADENNEDNDTYPNDDVQDNEDNGEDRDPASEEGNWANEQYQEENGEPGEEDWPSASDDDLEEEF